MKRTIPSHQLARLESEWKQNVYDKRDVIDGNSEQDWYSMSLGFALAKGLDPDKAHQFAIYIRYDTNVG